MCQCECKKPIKHNPGILEHVLAIVAKIVTLVNIWKSLVIDVAVIFDDMVDLSQSAYMVFNV